MCIQFRKDLLHSCVCMCIQYIQTENFIRKFIDIIKLKDKSIESKKELIHTCLCKQRQIRHFHITPYRSSQASSNQNVCIFIYRGHDMQFFAFFLDQYINRNTHTHQQHDMMYVTIAWSPLHSLKANVQINICTTNQEDIISMLFFSYLKTNITCIETYFSFTQFAIFEVQIDKNT